MTIHGTITFDGVDIRTFGNVDVVLGKPETTPSREFNVIQAAGRNGDIVLDNEKYANVNVSYWVMIRDNFEAVYRNIRGFLLSRTGYCRLSDSWHPDEFYQAYVNMPLEPNTYRNGDGGSFQVTFSRKPQRFFVSGDTDCASQFSVGSSQYVNGLLDNPSYFPSRPTFSIRLHHNNDTDSYAIVKLAGFWATLYNTAEQPVYSTALQNLLLWDGRYGLAFSPNLQNTVAVENDIIDIDCEARTVFNRTQGISLNDYAFITDSRYDAKGIDKSTYFYNDFPEIKPTIETTFKHSCVFTWYSEVLSFYPRWWTL